jgi:hypothetical protein
MALVATISRTNPISMDEWMKLVDSDQHLIIPRSRMVINPFNKTIEPSLPMLGEVDIVGAETELGSITPSAEFDDDGELDVWLPDGDPVDEVVGILNRIASELSAELVWMEEPA